jgi:hypothetical protein
VQYHRNVREAVEKYPRCDEGNYIVEVQSNKDWQFLWNNREFWLLEQELANGLLIAENH